MWLRELGWWNNGAVFRHISGIPSGQFLLTHHLTQKQESVDVLSSYRYGSTTYLYNTTTISKRKSTTKKQSNLFLHYPTYYGLKSRKLPIKRNKDTVPSSYSSWRNFKKYCYRQTDRKKYKKLYTRIISFLQEVWQTGSAHYTINKRQWTLRCGCVVLPINVWYVETQEDNV